ncbi:hypothetical protein L208DRAFT_1281675 [Tricholoma matsutake]|nr:hypothetical protein L208DRAFT_1281675 [Tricholoma matsutake 945]
MAILGKTRQNQKTNETTKKGQPSLDINRLMNQEHVEHLRKGLCFICHQPGHRLSNHRDGKNPTQMGIYTFPPMHYLNGSVLLATMNRQSMRLSIWVAESDNGKDVTTNVLLDSGAGGVFIDSKFVEQEGIKTYPLGYTIRAKAEHDDPHSCSALIWATNVDGTLNRQGTITRYVKGKLHINGRSCPMEYLVTGLGKESVILGLSWLREVNPIINWKKGTLEF